MISFTSSLEFITVILLDPTISLWIGAFIADAAAVNPNEIKTLLASGFSTFFILDNPVFINGPKSLTKIPLIKLFYTIECFVILY